ncbi:polyphosphate kinase 1 [Lacihabitans soyangensis]|jgi:polyphosphate kinase|uniref:Polyphosphate kinase n=1 Tax=Lacihabitans soyangensis TaxID=869394 RepID=A0AAE3H2K5_9BACT|nr:polyphosphate kinase 1 [Lacihabitans soyangensis]MCP9763623.1 polyphosphate kinase 1 [Lacihabitans soyangensis]
MGSVTEGVVSFFKDLLDFNMESEYKYNPTIKDQKSDNNIEKSNFISRDLSWMKFNERVLDQVRKTDLNIFEKLKFMAITASNLDEFMAVRLGSLYNYIDYDKERVDYSGLREVQFRKVLLNHIKRFIDERNRIFREDLEPTFEKNGFRIIKYNNLNEKQLDEVTDFFENTVYPMLTPMVCDHTHAFPNLLAKSLILGIVSIEQQTTLFPETEDNKKLSFVQIPSNLPKFYEFESEDSVDFLPTEEIIRNQIGKLYKNVTIESVDLFRIVRNGDFTIDENDDVDADFVDEVKEKIRSRQAGRVVGLVIETRPSEYLMEILKKKWEIDKYNIHVNNELMDYTRLWQIVNHAEFKPLLPPSPSTLTALNFNRELNIFDAIKENDILLHHPYNSFEPVLNLLEKAADDPNVLSIKLTIYRLAKNSRITSALLRAAENGKHVSALFEIKARFDEENNIREAEKLQKAGCFVIYGIGWLKTHTKLMLIVRKEGPKVMQYAHLASGNYNEDTSKLYTDIGLLTANQDYTKDIAEFFNVITGHSQPSGYKNLITSPKNMRNSLIEQIRNEANNAAKGLPAGICFKVNSLEDKDIIEELYAASNKGVKIELIVRGICCLRPGRKGLSENIRVRSLVGNYLEHARIIYFHNQGQPRVYGGSADMMVRSFDKRIESLFEFINEDIKRHLINILKVNLLDNCNAYVLQENGEYQTIRETENQINIHTYFFDKEKQSINQGDLF